MFPPKGICWGRGHRTAVNMLWYTNRGELAHALRKHIKTQAKLAICVADAVSLDIVSLLQPVNSVVELFCGSCYSQDLIWRCKASSMGRGRGGRFPYISSFQLYKSEDGYYLFYFYFYHGCLLCDFS